VIIINKVYQQVLFYDKQVVLKHTWTN